MLWMVSIIASGEIILLKCLGRRLPARGEDCLCLSSKMNPEQSNSRVEEPGSVQGACTEPGAGDILRSPLPSTFRRLEGWGGGV